MGFRWTCDSLRYNHRDQFHFVFRLHLLAKEEALAAREPWLLQQTEVQDWESLLWSQTSWRPCRRREQNWWGWGICVWQSSIAVTWCYNVWSRCWGKVSKRSRWLQQQPQSLFKCSRKIKLLKLTYALDRITCRKGIATIQPNLAWSPLAPIVG